MYRQIYIVYWYREYKKSHHLITALMLHFKESRLMSPMSNNLNSSSYHCSTEAYRGLHWLCFNLKTVILFIVLSKYIILWPHIYTDVLKFYTTYKLPYWILPVLLQNYKTYGVWNVDLRTWFFCMKTKNNIINAL